MKSVNRIVLCLCIMAITAVSFGCKQSSGTDDKTVPTITFKPNGGIGSDYTQVIASGGMSALDANTFSRPGWVFAGWAETDTGLVKYADVADYNMGTSSVDLYAAWKRWTRMAGADTVVDTTGYQSAIATDGSVYVVGTTAGKLDGQTITGTTDAFLTKYSSSGEKQWTKLSGVSGVSTSARGLTVDSSGAIYIVGDTYGKLDGQTINGTRDSFVCKYTSDGAKLWTRLSGVSGVDTIGNAVSTAAPGNIFVTGYSKGNLDGQTLTGTYDAFVIKYDSSGAKQWTTLVGVAGSGTPGRGIAVDSYDNSYITGDANGNLDGIAKTGTTDAYITKLNSSGIKQWTKLIGAASVITRGNGIDLDLNGNSFITGYTSGSLNDQSVTGSEDGFVAKYNSTGVRQWTRMMGVSAQATRGNGVSTDPSGNCYVAGQTTGSLDGQTFTGESDACVIKFNAAGDKQWTRLLGGNGKTMTVGNGLSCISSGTCYVTGKTTATLDGQVKTGNYDMFITTLLNE